MTFLFHRWVDGVRAVALASVFTFLGAGSVSAVEQLKFDLPLLDVSVSLNLKGICLMTSALTCD